MAGFFTTVSAAISGAIDEEFAEAQEAFEDAVEDVPEELQDAFETYVQAYADYAEALDDAGVDFDDPNSVGLQRSRGARRACRRRRQIFSDPELTEATTDISEFFANGCEV